MTVIEEKQKKKKEKEKQKKSQNVNSRIKPVHFCIYRVGDHLCTCYILSHSGKISSPSDRYWHKVIFWISLKKNLKRCRNDPVSARGTGNSNLHSQAISQIQYKLTCQQILVDETVVCLNTWCLEDLLWSWFFLAACNKKIMKQQCVWMFQVLLNTQPS